MFRPRVIPLLLLKNQGLVKSVNFKDHKYIGDPINAVKIFNDLRADEIVLLDIDATKENRHISIDFVRQVGEEANMPFIVGGGIRKIETIKELITAGAEKVIINSFAVTNPNFIAEASDYFGSSTISVCLDIKKNFWGKELLWINGGTQSVNTDPVEFAQMMADKGAGELVIQAISKDGTMSGYDYDLIKKMSKAVTIPIIALGGAGTYQDLELAYTQSYANGLAAGSLFVYHSKKRGVLINYPDHLQLKFKEA
jgi:imidazole glycerol-phosphate synthase subunit HisF